LVFFHTSFKGFFTIVLVAGGAGVQVDEAGSAGVAMAAAPTDGDRAASVEGASGPDAGPATAIVTSSARDGAGFTPSASVGLASSASFPVRGVSATL
jgi:glycerol uptake facilitator-like aquaporin